MDQVEDSNNSWQEEELLDATEPSIVSTLVSAARAPTLTVSAVAGVTAVVLLAIAAVFLLGLLIDCRQQKLLEKMGRIKRVKHQKRLKNSLNCNTDEVSIAGNMEETATSAPPADVLRNIP